MYSYELFNIIENDNESFKWNWSIIAIDELYKIITNKPSFYIVNTSPHFMNGIHWFCIFINGKNEPIEIFDSLPKPLFNYNNVLMKFLKQFNQGYLINTSRIQDYYSESCGKFCYFFIYHRIRGNSFEKIVNLFSNVDFNFNEELVHSLILNE